MGAQTRSVDEDQTLSVSEKTGSLLFTTGTGTGFYSISYLTNVCLKDGPGPAMREHPLCHLSAIPCCSAQVMKTNTNF